jgi:hypothetical protein
MLSTDQESSILEQIFASFIIDTDIPFSIEMETDPEEPLYKNYLKLFQQIETTSPIELEQRTFTSFLQDLLRDKKISSLSQLAQELDLQQNLLNLILSGELPDAQSGQKFLNRFPELTPLLFSTLYQNSLAAIASKRNKLPVLGIQQDNTAKLMELIQTLRKYKDPKQQKGKVFETAQNDFFFLLIGMIKRQSRRIRDDDNRLNAETDSYYKILNSMVWKEDLVINESTVWGLIRLIIESVVNDELRKIKREATRKDSILVFFHNNTSSFPDNNVDSTDIQIGSISEDKQFFINLDQNIVENIYLRQKLDKLLRLAFKQLDETEAQILNYTFKLNSNVKPMKLPVFLESLNLSKHDYYQKIKEIEGKLHNLLRKEGIDLSDYY